MMNDELTQFLAAWLKERPFMPGGDADSCVMDYGSIRGCRLYREGNFQVQLFTALPNSEAVDHVHPDMDSYEVYVSGDIMFRANDERFVGSQTGQVIRIKPNCWHGATFGDRGGVFLSVQHWLNGVAPSCAGQNWQFKSADQLDKAYLLETA